MPTIIVDGVEYVPKAEVPDVTNEQVSECLKVLTEMRYFNESHKMRALAYNAIMALSPELAEVDERTAFDMMHKE
ncbi:hypothetical protein [Vibrio sp. D431a]|uniref:hypothetical protein n=1 Tax=Vibrio sp. D431a TaxID=2837388 RepID=UPI0025522504|nr:hypothetical protein [Vibrio sp. D431a]MDK9793767.1 hypothetical protein [Vibrio sp. D431a]